MADTTPTLREAAQQAMEALAPLANATTPAEREALTDADAQAADAASCDLRAALAEQAAEQAVPVAGFRLLPSRLTNEMRAAMADAARAYMARTGGNSPDAMYDAAVAAAPPAPAAAPAGEPAACISRTQGRIYAQLLPAGRSLPLGTSLYPQQSAAMFQPAPARQEWQPIETAPKTGAKIIVRYVNRNNKPRTVMARWLTDEQAEETDADGVGLKGGWYECIDNWDDYTEVAIHEGAPSLWMPLPAAPITAAPAAPARQEWQPLTQSHVDYVLQYGGRCRECADWNGICPSSGLPCGGAEKAVQFVLRALNYGFKHGYITAAPAEGGAA